MSDEVYGMGFVAGQSFRINLVAECEEALRTTHSALQEAERRIAAALAVHWRATPQSLVCAHCAYPWDTTLDRCSSPTVTALTTA